MWEEIAIGVGAALLILAFLTRKNVNLPGPTEWPIVANGIDVAFHLHRLLDYVLDRTREYNWQTWTFKIPLVPRFVVVLTPEGLEHMLKTRFDNYPKGRIFHENLEQVIGDGIFGVDGEAWHVQRKTASHMFSARMFQDVMHPVFREHGTELQRILADAERAGTQVDMQDLFFRYTLESIGEIAFGARIGAMKDPNNAFARAFDCAQFLAEKRFFNPFWRLTEPLTGTKKQLTDAVRVMDEFSLRLIRERRDSGDFVKREDVLSRFMQLKDDTGAYAVLHDDKYLRDVVMNFMIAGRDTTAQALSWTVYLLTQHPDVERRLCEEIDRAIGLADGPTYDQACHDLPYTTAVVKEALRLYPSVPKDVKFNLEDDTLPDGSFVPAGCFVVYVPYLMGRDPRLWDEPLKFNPQRFLDDPNPSPFKYPVFNAGPRTCLGRHMALFEAATALAMIYSRFSLRAVPNQTITYQNSLTMPQLRGIRVTVTKRTDRATGRGAAAAAAASPPAPTARAGGHAMTPDAPESASGLVQA